MLDVLGVAGSWASNFLHRAWQQPYSNGLLVVGILVLLIVFSVTTYHYVSACKQVETALQDSLGVLSKTENQKGLASEWGVIDLELCDRPIIGESWKQFSATVLLPEQPGRPLRQAEPIEDFFDPPSLLAAAHITPRLHRAMPNILVGIGLLFTFLGLIIALSSAGDSVGASNPEVSRSALKGLLDAAGVKFVSSFLGLLFSILALITHKHWESRLDKAVQRLRVAVSLLIPPATSLFLIEQTNELMRESLRVQETMFNDLAVKIGDSLGNALNDTMGRHLAAQMEPLRASIDRMAETMGRMNQDALDQMVQQFGTLLQDTAGTQIRGLADTLNGVGERLSTLTDGFTAAGNQVRDAGQEAAANLAGMVTEVSGGVADAARQMREATQAAAQDFQSGMSGATGEMRVTMAAAAEALSAAAADGARQLRDAVSSISAAVSPLIATLAELPEPLREAAAAVATQVVALQAVGKQLEPTAETLRKASSSAADANNALISAGEAVRETARVLQVVGSQGSTTQERLQETAVVLRTAAERFEGLDRQIASVFVATETGLRTTTQSIASFAEGVDNQTARAVTALGGAINDLRDMLDDLPSVSRRSTSAVGD